MILFLASLLIRSLTESFSSAALDDPLLESTFLIGDYELYLVNVDYFVGETFYEAGLVVVVY